MTSSTPLRSAAGMALTCRKELGLSFLEAGQGTPVVLLHGIPGSALAWAAVGERLAGEYRLVIPDLLGFGRSDPPGGDYYMEAQAHRVRGCWSGSVSQSWCLGVTISAVLSP